MSVKLVGNLAAKPKLSKNSLVERRRSRRPTLRNSGGEYSYEYPTESNLVLTVKQAKAFSAVQKVNAGKQRGTAKRIPQSTNRASCLNRKKSVIEFPVFSSADLLNTINIASHSRDSDLRDGVNSVSRMTSKIDGAGLSTLLEVLKRSLSQNLSVGFSASNAHDAQFLPTGFVPPRSEDQALLKQPTIGELLSLLKDPKSSLDRQVDAIYEAELIPLSVEFREAFLKQLKNFIVLHRDTQDYQLLSAVACAVRKFIAEVPGAELNDIGFLLEAGHSVQLPIELEVTVCKMLIRKLTANPLRSDNPYFELDSQLNEIVDAYVNDKLLSMRYFGAAALNSVLVLLLMRSPATPAILNSLVKLKSRWFVESVSDRAADVIQEIVSRNPIEKQGPTVKALQAAIQFMGVQQLSGDKRDADPTT